MTSPRTDQVGELTRGLKLPLPPIAPVHLNVIAEGLKRALDQLVVEHGNSLGEKEEKELNALLQTRMNTLCAEERILSQLIVCVVRGGESVSFDGKRLELRPDLGIYLTGRNRNFPLVVECKIIDTADGKGVDLYCAHGIRRFVDGMYAWSGSQGLMLAYVRDESSIGQTLTPHLTASAANDLDPLRTQKMPITEGGKYLAVWTSQHGRTFEYVGSERSRPGPIGIAHLWFDVPRAGNAA